MSRKRQNTSSAEPESPRENDNHNSRNYGSFDVSAQGYEQPAIDSRFGQVGAFPGLTDDDTFYYGPPADGIEYLRMVRSEANGIPLFLSATIAQQQAQVIHNDEDEAYEGFFDEDEAFVAAPAPVKDVSVEYSAAQLSYYEAINSRFLYLRAQLASTPPLHLVQALPETTPISFPSSLKSAREAWEEYITQNMAHPVQVACMDSDSVLELIKFMTKKMRKLFQPQSRANTQRMGTWLWAALAKCPERGLLGSEEIAELRACAKAADMTRQWLQKRIGDVAEGDADTDADSEASSVEAGAGDKVHSVHAEAEAQKGETNMIHSDWSTDRLNDAGDDPFQEQQIILDMIVTVVGEAYGQRDLLELRRPWPTD